MRISINIEDNITPTIALWCVQNLVAMGGVGTSFLTEDGLVWVVQEKDGFNVYKDKSQNNAI